MRLLPVKGEHLESYLQMVFFFYGLTENIKDKTTITLFHFCFLSNLQLKRLNKEFGDELKMFLEALRNEVDVPGG